MEGEGVSAAAGRLAVELGRAWLARPWAATRIHRKQIDAFHKATVDGDSELVGRMLEEAGRGGAAVLLESRNSAGWTPLMWASWHAKVGVMRLLVQGRCNVNASDRYGQSALSLAAGNPLRSPLQRALSLARSLARSVRPSVRLPPARLSAGSVAVWYLWLRANLVLSCPSRHREHEQCPGSGCHPTARCWCGHYTDRLRGKDSSRVGGREWQPTAGGADSTGADAARAMDGGGAAVGHGEAATRLSLSLPSLPPSPSLLLLADGLTD